jgi:hypothetical protein
MRERFTNVAAMNPTNELPKTLHADAEHGGLRAAVVVLMITAVFLSFRLLNLLFETFGGPDYAIFLSCAGAVPLGLLLVWFAEQGLKQIWHSGRKITLTQHGVESVEGKARPVKYYWNNHTSGLLWQFSLKGFPRGGRERRLPANWHCLACQLTQGENRLIAFTYVSPKTKQRYMTDFEFVELDLGDVYSKSTFSLRPPSRPDIPAKVLTGKHGRFWVAEKRRWQEGFELSPADFETFVTAVMAHAAKSEKFNDSLIED